jgi:hypothetical protein
VTPAFGPALLLLPQRGSAVTEGSLVAALLLLAHCDSGRSYIPERAARPRRMTGEGGTILWRGGPWFYQDPSRRKPTW